MYCQGLTKCYPFSVPSLYGRSDVRLIPSLRSISLNGVPFANSRMITLKSVIVAFLFAISLWFLFSYHKGTCSTQSNPSVVCLTTGTCSSASGGTFENATDGTFHSATAGTFVSARPGTFNPLLSFKLKSNVKVNVEFGLVALAHNLRKYIAIERMRSNAVSSCL